jgi:hypothetical protein
MTELTDLLKSDPTGLSAATYLGRRSAELSKPSKRTTGAPTPAKTAAGQSGSASESAQARKYKAAFKAGDAQKAFNIKMEAKRSGIPVKNW